VLDGFAPDDENDGGDPQKIPVQQTISSSSSTTRIFSVVFCLHDERLEEIITPFLPTPGAAFAR
jgi:hypothetical protein